MRRKGGVGLSAFQVSNRLLPELQDRLQIRVDNFCRSSRRPITTTAKRRNPAQLILKAGSIGRRNTHGF